MAKERLSKLQKWILVRCIQNQKTGMEKGNPNTKPFIYYETIYSEYFGCKYKEPKPNKYAVTLCRSVDRLWERGWIIHLLDYGRPCGLVLTNEDAIEKAKSLMLIDDINIKK
jgi:hypothetical protein